MRRRRSKQRSQQAHQEEEGGGGGGGGGGGEEEPRQEHGTKMLVSLNQAKSRNFVTLFWWSRRRSELSWGVQGCGPDDDDVVEERPLCGVPESSHVFFPDIRLQSFIYSFLLVDISHEACMHAVVMMACRALQTHHCQPRNTRVDDASGSSCPGSASQQMIVDL